MSTMIREIYDALKDAGVTEEKAAAEASAVADVRDESRLRGIDDRLGRLEGDVRLLRWMIGFNLALSAKYLCFTRD